MALRSGGRSVQLAPIALPPTSRAGEIHAGAATTKPITDTASEDVPVWA